MEKNTFPKNVVRDRREFDNTCKSLQFRFHDCRTNMALLKFIQEYTLMIWFTKSMSLKSISQKTIPKRPTLKTMTATQSCVTIVAGKLKTRCLEDIPRVSSLCIIAVKTIQLSGNLAKAAYG